MFSSTSPGKAIQPLRAGSTGSPLSLPMSENSCMQNLIWPITPLSRWIP
jgi:hypothetical protein